jgi:RNA polymerase sigma-70 factor (ECF subfamily)
MSTKSEINKYSSVQKLNKVEFVNKIRAGDSAAFEDLFNSYSQQLINFARHYVFDKQIAENIVQDVFVSVWQRRTNLDPSKMIKAYLFTAVKNEALKHKRRLDVEKKSYNRILESYSEFNPDIEIEGKEVGYHVNQAVNELPEKCKEIFKMNRFENLKYAEIAEILDISIKTVETQMGRALKKLRKRLKPILTMILFVLTSILILTV